MRFVSEIDDAKTSWLDSANAWIEFVRTGDLNRTHLLDKVMLDAVGDVSDLNVIDIGCGEGRFCRMLADRGACVTGIDLTGPLVMAAKQAHPEGKYFIGDAANLQIPDRSQDLAVSYVALIDVADYQKAIFEMARVLRPGGRALIANLNGFITSQPDWIRDADGKKLYFPVDDYFREHADRYSWRNMSIINWHRPMEAYMSAFLDAGLRLEMYREPRPDAQALLECPQMADSLRLPWFHVMMWSKDS